MVPSGSCRLCGSLPAVIPISDHYATMPDPYEAPEAASPDHLAYRFPWLRSDASTDTTKSER